jgi:hypothetical protein
LSELSRSVSRDWINTGQGLRDWLVPAFIAPNAFKTPLYWLAIATLLADHCQAVKSTVTRPTAMQ